MDQDISNLLAQIEFTIEQARALASAIARGTGGREVALCITNMQYAQWVLQEGQRLIGLEGAKGRIQTLKEGA